MFNGASAADMGKDRQAKKHKEKRTAVPGGNPWGYKSTAADKVGEAARMRPPQPIGEPPLS